MKNIRKELWFGFSLMAAIIIAILVLMPWGNTTNGHIGLLMLALIVVAIMLGFPTAFTLMGMGVFFAWYSYYTANPDLAIPHTLDLFVQRTYGVMSNDVLIAIPLFLFMGYLVERAQLIDRLFRSLHLATMRVPGSLAVATIITCAIFATATGIVGAVVTLMGLLAFPAMLKAGYNIKVSAGAVTAGGCLGILIPPSVLLIVYGATAGVSVVQLYAGAFFPGFMLAGLYIGYVIVLAKLKPALMPPLPESEQRVPLPPAAQALLRRGENPLTVLAGALVGDSAGVKKRTVLGQFVVTLVPALFISFVLAWVYQRCHRAGLRNEHCRTRPGGRGRVAGIQGVRDPGRAGGISCGAGRAEGSRGRDACRAAHGRAEANLARRQRARASRGRLRRRPAPAALPRPRGSGLSSASARAC